MLILRPFGLLFALFIVSFFSWVSASDLLCAPKAFAKIKGGAVFNNIWGISRDPVNGFSQCMIVGDSEVIFRWKNFEHGQGKVKSFPHITSGWDWNGLYTDQSIFPLNLDDALGLVASYNVITTGSGTYNTAFDVWMSRTRLPGRPRQDLTHEVMIWIHRNNWNIPRKRSGVVRIDGRLFDLYNDPTTYGSWRVVSFVAHQSIMHGKLKLGAFFSYLKSIGVLSGNEYVNGISFGNEIVHGNGETVINNFNIIREVDN